MNKFFYCLNNALTKIFESFNLLVEGRVKNKILDKFTIGECHMTRKVYFNGNIITVDSKESIAQAMLIEDGKIKAVGNNDEILNLLEDRKSVV